MKFCYIDESGTGDEPYAVMVGVLIDAYRMRPTKADWDGLLQHLTELVERPVIEFHTRDFYAGNTPWRGLHGGRRADVISAIFQWFAGRRHHIVISAIDKEKFDGEPSDHPFMADIGGVWRCLALHMALSIQKHSQRQKKNKGNTVMVFDEHGRDEKDFAELVLTPPAWTETYYDRSKKQAPLDQIVDVPHFVDSAHVGLIQVADCFSYFLRRHLEIHEEKIPPRYDGEAEMVGEWVEMALDCCIPMASIYPKKGRCNAAELFFSVAPNTLI